MFISLAAIFLWCRRHLPAAAGLVLALIFFLAGLAHVQPYFAPPAGEHLAGRVQSPQKATVVGRLQTAPSRTAEKTRLQVAAEFLYLPEQDKWLPAPGLVQISLPGKVSPGLLPGNLIAIRATLAPPGAYGTPGAFDFASYLAANGIQTIGWADSPSAVLKINALGSRDFFSRAAYLAERFHHRVAIFFDENVPFRYRGLYKALLIGDRGELTPELDQNFKKTGAFHLIAISGMHMSVVAFFFFSGTTWLLKRSTRLLMHGSIKKIAAAASLPALIFYALAAGFQPPVARALLMIAVFVVAVMFDRQWHLPTNVALAAFIILLWMPASLYTASFQLSFAAVIGLVLAAPMIKKFSPSGEPRHENSAGQRMRAWARASLVASAAAMLTTAPLQIYHFNIFPLLSPFSTLLTTPFLCLWALPLGLAAMVVIPLMPAVASFLLTLGTMGLWIGDKITAALARLPFTTPRFTTPSLLEMALFYAAVSGCYIMIMRPQHRTLGRRLLTGSVVLLAGVTFGVKAMQLLRSSTELSFIDLGQGNATLLEMPHGRTVLVDGGADANENFNPGERVLAPFLWKKRIAGLDAIVITHQHADHYNGIGYLLENFSPGILWINDYKGNEPDFTALLEQARQLGIAVRVPAPGEVIAEADKATLTNLAGLHLTQASAPADGYGQEAENNRSMVLRLAHGNHAVILPGDIQRPSEMSLLAGDYDLNADVLLAAHHGSKTSNSPEFLAEVSPSYLIVSAGRQRARHFPAQRLRNYCREKDIRLLTTAEAGTVSFAIGPAGIRGESYREGVLSSPQD